MTDAPNKNEEGDGFWTGLIVGGLLGTVAGFFIGGDDKNELKGKIKNKAFDIWDNLGDFSRETKDKVLDFKDDAIEEAEEVEQKAGQAADVARQKIKSIADSAQQAIEEQTAEIKKVVKNNSNSFRKKFFFHGGRSLQKKAK